MAPSIVEKSRCYECRPSAIRRLTILGGDLSIMRNFVSGSPDLETLGILPEMIDFVSGNSNMETPGIPPEMIEFQGRAQEGGALPTLKVTGNSDTSMIMPRVWKGLMVREEDRVSTFQRILT